MSAVDRTSDKLINLTTSAADSFSQDRIADLEAEEGQLDADFHFDSGNDSTQGSDYCQDCCPDFEADEGSPEGGLDADALEGSEGFWGYSDDVPELDFGEGFPVVHNRGELSIVRVGDWDNSDNGYDFEAAERATRESRIFSSWTDKYDIPLEIQLYWYPWMVYEIDECIDKYREVHRWEGCDGVAPRGYTGPLGNVNALISRFNNGWKFEGLDEVQDMSPGDSFYGARELRHITEHRQEPMHFYAMQGALNIPVILGDTACKERLNEVYNALTTKFRRDDSTSSTPSTSSTSVEYETTYREAYEIITRPWNFDYSPFYALLHYFVDSLRLASFNWADRIHPECFTTEHHYKAYEPKFWARKYPYKGRGAECEGAKTAFPSNDPSIWLLDDAFEGLVEIRNNFVHRQPVPEQEEIDDRSPKGRFWVMKRSAVKLALLLGEVDLALDFDVAIRVFQSGSKRKGEILEEFQKDEVKATVEDLMSGAEERREAVLSSGLFCGDASYKEYMRQRWVCLDLLIEGEYMIRNYEAELAKPKEDNSSPDESDEAESDEPKTPPASSVDFEATEIVGWDWS